MINRDQMFEPMLAACPSFATAYQQFCADWKDEPGELPHYIALGDLARHLIDMLREGDTANFQAIFHVVERWHTEGDAYVREAATIGLLEGIQNNAEHQGVDPAAFQPWLGPESKKWWDKLNRFWDGEVGALRGD